MGEPAISQDMSLIETWTPSRRMRSAALAERERIERELARVTARRDDLTRELAAAEASEQELRDHLAVLNRFAHEFDDEAPNGRARLTAVPEPENGSSKGGAVVLRGARIRETAVRVLAGAPEARGPVHYKTWFELFTRQGFIPAGKDPGATFLTQIGRSPVVERTSQAGTYQLDFAFPRKARQRLAQLRSALAATHDLPVDSGIDAIAEARARRAQLTSEIEATERALEEALRSLGEGE
jgi:cell division septum initiation protein DivIVA